MSRHNVSVSQLHAMNYGSRPQAFLNVDENIYGAIGVRGICYETPTYLLKNGVHFQLIQFCDDECALEWLEATKEINQDYEVIKLQPNKPLAHELESSVVGGATGADK